MVRRRARRNYAPVEDDEFEESFVVSGEESFIINGDEIVVTNTLHVIKEGQEYIVIDDALYPLASENDVNESYEQYTKETVPVKSGLGTWGFFAIFIVFGIFSFLFAGPFIAGLAADISDPDNQNIIVPGKSDTSSTPSPLTAQSVESRRAEKIKIAMDYMNPVTRDYAVSLIPNSHEGKYNIAQICDLWDRVYNKWTYVSDPQGEGYYSPASRTIQIGLKGDCDDYAITVGSLIQSIGGSSRIVTAYNEKGGHAYPEVMICKDKACLEKISAYINKRYHTKGIAYHTQTKDGVTQYWLNLDWQSRYPGGKYFHDDDGKITIYYPNGYWYHSG